MFSLRYFSIISASLVMLFSCKNKNVDKKEIGFEKARSEFAAYFYPEYTKPKVYIFRDSLSPLMEQYHRIYTKNILDYRHNILEIYQTGGRFSEAYTYKLNDSLSLMAHTVFDRNKNKEGAEVLRADLMPMNKYKSSYFVSRFKGPQDSTMMLAEIKRAYWKGPLKMKIMGKNMDVIIMNDSVRQTMFNPFTKQEKVLNVLLRTVFAKHLGAVGFYTDDKQLNMKLEKIVSDKEWSNLIRF
jgi:hypothetical protein